MERGTVTIPLERYEALLHFESSVIKAKTDEKLGALLVVETSYNGYKKHFFFSNDEAIASHQSQHNDEISAFKRHSKRCQVKIAELEKAIKGQNRKAYLSRITIGLSASVLLFEVISLAFNLF